MKFMYIATVLFLLPFSGWSGTFLETFDGEGLEEWKELVQGNIQGNKGPGFWEVVDGELHAVNRETFVRLLTTGDNTWKDYTIEFDVKPLKKHGIGGIAIAARVQETWLVYCQIHDPVILIGDKPPIHEARVGCFAGSLHRPSFVQLFLEPHPLLRLNRWSHLKLNVEGNIFTFWLNGEQIMAPTELQIFKQIEVFADFPDFQTGGVGFGLANYTARFDNIIVTGDSIPNSGGFAVTPHGKLTTTWGNLKLTADR